METYYKQVTIAFKKHLKDVSLKYGFSIEKSFTHWYLYTKFGNKANIYITDGALDGEIDGIVFQGNALHIIQTKYSDRIFCNKNPSTLSTGDYSKFDKTISNFETKKIFEKYISTIERSLRPIYNKVFDKITNDPDYVNWELVSLHAASHYSEKRTINLDKLSFFYYDYILKLFELSLEGGTPLARQLELTFVESPLISEDLNRSIKSYVAQVYLKDFISYSDEDPFFFLISRNVRNDLHSDINEKIKDTYLNYPEDFWYSHNGMTIICEKAKIEGKKFILKSPNVINGAQTIHSIKGLKIRNPKAKVLVRIIEVPTNAKIDSKFLNNIILRTNQQNKIYTYDLKANDPIQVSLATNFLEHNIFYERRRGDWEINKRIYKNSGLTKIDTKNLAKILMSCNYNLGGVITARENIEALFEDKLFYKIFKLAFDEILFKYDLHNTILSIINKISYKNVTKGEKRATSLTCFSLVWECIESNVLINEWYTKNLINSKLGYSFAVSNTFKNTVKNLFKDCWNEFLKESKKQDMRPTDFFSKSKKYNQQLRNKFVKKYTKPFSKVMSSIYK